MAGTVVLAILMLVTLWWQSGLSWWLFAGYWLVAVAVNALVAWLGKRWGRASRPAVAADDRGDEC